MIMTRVAAEDFDLEGTFIPKGTNVGVDLSSIHLSPRNWKNPDQFLPDRFAEGGEHEDHSSFSWIPFSTGSRQCIGMNFSLTEQRVALSMLCKFSLSLFLH